LTYQFTAQRRRDAAGEVVVMALIQFQSQIQSGAILTVDATTSRIKVLPIRK
jgi:hypothetical protein